MLIFSENDQKWQPVPSWVEFLVRLGYHWHSGVLQQRRIALISMPCDSAAAGLISLGALIRDLGSPDTNDIDGHYSALLRYARQYIEGCCFCTDCNPEKRRCGHTVKATGWIRNWHQTPSKRYKISEKTDFVERRLLLSHKGGTWWQDPRYSTNWQIDGEPPVKLTAYEGVLAAGVYAQLIDNAKIIPDNLQRSYSGLCFAGRVAGESVTREMCASVRFCFEDSVFYLPELLTVHGWTPAGSLSRMSFFNSRTEQFDRYSSEAALVIADGDKSFLKNLGRFEFKRSDVIGVIHRIIERADLEAVGNRINALRQWYSDDSETLDRLSPVPQGISIMVLKRRTA